MILTKIVLVRGTQKITVEREDVFNARLNEGFEIVEGSLVEMVE